MFIIVDLGALIIFLAILGIGLGYTIISNIGPILFMITSIIAFFGGGYIFFTGFTKKTISHKIATCVKGLMIMTIFIYVLFMIDSAAWGDNLSKGSYIVIEHFDFLMKNIFFTSLIVGLVLIEVALIPGQIKVLADITSKKGEAILNIISIFLVIAIYVATFQITVKDNFNNNIGAFAELNNPKYEVMQNVDIRNYDLLFAKTGSFKAGTKLYSHGSSMEYKDEYSRAMKSHFRKFGNQMSGSGNHLCNYASLLA